MRSPLLLLVADPVFLAWALETEKWAAPLDLARERILIRRSEMARGVGRSVLSEVRAGGRG